MDSPETWRWIWLAAAVLFATGEMTSPGSFFLAPFAIGATLATVLAFLGVGVGVQWFVFVAVSAGSFLALRPVARRLDRTSSAQGVGARRLIGESGTVLDPIPPGAAELGLVRIGREEWRAESIDNAAIPAGAEVEILEVKGTRVIVWPTDRSVPPIPPATPPTKEVP